MCSSDLDVLTTAMRHIVAGMTRHGVRRIVWIASAGIDGEIPGPFGWLVQFILRHVLAGAGGWGDPLERDPAAVLKDVRNELLSAAKAATDYGVIVDTKTWTVDAAATKAARDGLRAARAWREVPKVQWTDPVSEVRAAE